MDELDKLQSIINDLKDTIFECNTRIDNLEDKFSTTDYHINKINIVLDSVATDLDKIENAIEIYDSREVVTEDDIIDLQKQINEHDELITSINLNTSKFITTIEGIENRLNELAGYKKIMFR